MDDSILANKSNKTLGYGKVNLLQFWDKKENIIFWIPPL